MNIVAFTKELVAVARSQVGVKESGNNGGTLIREYQSKTWLEPGAWPWCAAFVCWCISAASAKSGHPVPVPNTPRAREFTTWGRRNFSLIHKPRSVAPGDIVIYQFKSGWHVGIACEFSAGSTVDVVEGNTDGSGGREGDGVYIRNRKLSSIHSVVSWNRAKKIHL